MGIKNKDGETPGQILGWGPPWDSAEEEEEDEASKEREWRQKLQGELEDEWQEVMGRFEGEESIPTYHCPLPQWLLILHPPPDAPTGLLCPLPLYFSAPLAHHLTTSPPTLPSCPRKQMTFPVRPRNPSPSPPGRIAWPGNMPRSVSSNSVRQRESADLHGLRDLVTAGDSRRRSSGSSESEPGPRRKNCVRAEPGGHRRLLGTKGQSQPGQGPEQSTPEGRGGVASGASVTYPGPALGAGTQRPWLQPW